MITRPHVDIFFTDGVRLLGCPLGHAALYVADEERIYTQQGVDTLFGEVGIGGSTGKGLFLREPLETFLKDPYQTPAEQKLMRFRVFLDRAGERENAKGTPPTTPDPGNQVQPPEERLKRTLHNVWNDPTSIRDTQDFVQSSAMMAKLAANGRLKHLAEFMQEGAKESEKDDKPQARIRSFCVLRNNCTTLVKQALNAAGFVFENKWIALMDGVIDSSMGDSPSCRSTQQSAPNYPFEMEFVLQKMAESDEEREFPRVLSLDTRTLRRTPEGD